MKYIIIGYTSNIDIKSNTAKITYMSKSNADCCVWTDDIKQAYSFKTRRQAEMFIYSRTVNCMNPIKMISYGIEE